MTNFLRFNTGRPYGPEGQLIECAVVDSIPMFDDAPELGTWFTIILEDQTRGLLEVLELSKFNEESIMETYDACAYKGYPSLEQMETFKRIKNSQ